MNSGSKFILKIAIIFPLTFSILACLNSSTNNELPELFENSSLAGMSNDVLPLVEVADLKDREIQLPIDFPTQYNFVIFDIQDQSNTETDTWVKKISQQIKQRSDLSVLKIPIFKPTSAISRSLVRSSLKELHRESLHAKIAPIFIEQERFLSALDLSPKSAPHVILFENTGYVLWKDSGDFNQKKMATALDVLDAGA